MTAPLRLQQYNSFDAPDPSLWTGSWVYFTDVPGPAWSNGSEWFWQSAWLNADKTFYVNPAGNDGYPGTSSYPFKTILGAWIFLQNRIYAAGHQITIQLQNGTYDLSSLGNTFGYLVSPLPAHLPYGLVVIRGDITTPSNVTIDVKGSSGIHCNAGVQVDVAGIKFIDTAGGGFFFDIAGSGALASFRDCDFGSGSSIQLFASSGGMIRANGISYTISGGNNIHCYSQSCATIDIEGCNVTITGTPNFGSAFVAAVDSSHVDYSGNTITGSATGVRFVAEGAGSIRASSLTSIPGNAAGQIKSNGVFADAGSGITYTQLPIAYTASPYGITAFEGQTQAFNDSNTAVWGANIAGGGANHVLGYYNGTNWTVMGK